MRESHSHAAPWMSIEQSVGYERLLCRETGNSSTCMERSAGFPEMAREDKHPRLARNPPRWSNCNHAWTSAKQFKN